MMHDDSYVAESPYIATMAPANSMHHHFPVVREHFSVPCMLLRWAWLLTNPGYVLQEKVAHATIDEELARDPAMAKKIDQEISEGNFIP